jgi:hypothetical protein
MLCFYEKKTDKQFVCVHNILTEIVYVTKLSSNAEISVWQISWVTTNCLFMNNRIGCLIFQIFKTAYRIGYEISRLSHYRCIDWLRSFQMIFEANRASQQKGYQGSISLGTAAWAFSCPSTIHTVEKSKTCTLTPCLSIRLCNKGSNHLILA